MDFFPIGGSPTVLLDDARKFRQQQTVDVTDVLCCICSFGSKIFSKGILDGNRNAYSPSRNLFHSGFVLLMVQKPGEIDLEKIRKTIPCEACNVCSELCSTNINYSNSNGLM